MELKKLNDQTLVSMYLSGNEQAFKTLLLRHKRIVYGVIYNKIQHRELAEDIFHDTFIKVIDNLKLGKYNEAGKFLPWMLRIANNLVIDYFRRNNKFRKLSFYTNEEEEPLDIFNFIGSQENSIEDDFINKQIIQDIHKLIHQLPPEQQAVIRMRFFMDLTFKEIAEDLNISINTALGRMRYALINLRKMVEEKNINLYSQ